jgi:cytoskeletal protein RodZ
MPPERPSSGDFGAKLRAARERKGVSLRQIATATKISIAALEALERNDISRLPGGIFSRAFVRSYASEVGLDPEATIQDFIAQFPQDTVTAGHPTSDQVFDNETFESDRRISTTFLGLLVICVPLAGAVVYFSTAGRRASSPAAVTAVAPPPAPAPAVSSSAQPPETPATAQPDAVPAVSPAVATPAPEESFTVVCPSSGHAGCRRWLTATSRLNGCWSPAISVRSKSGVRWCSRRAMRRPSR